MAEGEGGADAGSRRSSPSSGAAAAARECSATCISARGTRERGGFVMLGKTFKGLTDEMLAWQTKRFLELEIARDAYTVYVRPEVVAEIAFNDIQASPQYPGGLALRFARVKRYRHDKTAAEADTFATIQTIYQQTTGEPPPMR